jgi:hypothetical protein
VTDDEFVIAEVTGEPIDWWSSTQSRQPSQKQTARTRQPTLATRHRAVSLIAALTLRAMARRAED